MNEEEKQAIKKFEELLIKHFEDKKIDTVDYLDYFEGITILNLIEKQQKEIEELKDKIKVKIEEYKKKCDECNYQNTGICKEFKAYNCCSIQSVLEILNELLGE